MPWICEISFFSNRRDYHLFPLDLFYSASTQGSGWNDLPKLFWPCKSPVLCHPRPHWWEGLPGMWMWEREGSKDINKLWPPVEDEVSLKYSTVCSILLKSPLHSPAKMDKMGDEAETQKGECCYSCHLLVGQVNSSHPPFPILWNTDGNNLTWSLDWEFSEKRCTMFGTSNTLIVCVSYVKY